MNGRASLITALLVISASIAVGGGAALLLKSPGARSPADAPSPVVTMRTPAAGPARTDGTYPLLPGAAAVPRPDMPGRLVIASINLDAPIVPVGTALVNGRLSWETAAFAVGYYNTTARPGSIGNSVMAGHISSPVSHKGDIFRHLPEVRVGDLVQVYVGQRSYDYRVTQVYLVPPSAVQVMAPTSDATLTLLTCYPDGVYNQRLVVVGKLDAGPPS